MKSSGVARYGTLAAGAGAILVSAVGLQDEPGGQQYAAALFAVGCVMLGAWLTIEVYHLWNAGGKNTPEKDDAP